MRDSQKQEIRRYLAQGKTLEEAAACAGVRHNDALTWHTHYMRELFQERLMASAKETTNRVSRAMEALDKIVQGGAAPKIRVQAANAILRHHADLLRISNSHTAKIADISDEDQKSDSQTLWDFT